jgi:hypothetical protein
MPLWIRGNELTPAQEKKVLACFNYRWTVDNTKRADCWRDVPEHDQPSMALISDEEWLHEHAFYFSVDGKRLMTRTSARPAYMAESGTNPLTPEASADVYLTFRLGEPGSYGRTTCSGRPGLRLLRQLREMVARDRQASGASGAAAARLGQASPVSIVTGLHISPGMLTVDNNSMHGTRQPGGLAVTMESAASLARGDYLFSEYAYKYHAHSDYVWAQYCNRCKGTGNWSNKKPTSRRCSVCGGDGRTTLSREMTRLSGQTTLSHADITWWCSRVFGKTELTEMVLDGRLHAIGEDRYMFGPWIATVYVDYFKPIWVDASPAALEYRDGDMLSELTGSCGASESEARLILEYLKDRHRVTRLAASQVRIVSPEEASARKARGIDV